MSVELLGIIYYIVILSFPKPEVALRETGSGVWTGSGPIQEQSYMNEEFIRSDNFEVTLIFLVTTKTLRARLEKTENKKPSYYCPTREGVSKVSEQVSEWAQRIARAKGAVWSKRMSEWCEQKSERTSEWPSTPICILRYSGPQCKSGGTPLFKWCC